MMHFHTRRLGKLEKFQWLVDEACCVNAVVHAKLVGTISEHAVRSALKCLVEKYSPLQVGVIRDGWSEGRFTPSINRGIPFQIVHVPENLVFQIIEYELQTPHNVIEGPLVRCVLARHFDEHSTLIITFHHIIGDGLTGVSLMKSMLAFLNGMITGHQDLVSPQVPGLPAEAYFHEEINLRKFIKRSWEAVFSHLIAKNKWVLPEVPPVDGQDCLTNRKPIIAMRELPREIIDRLSDLARRENSTVNGALAASFVLAILEELDPDEMHYIMLLSPVNLRGLIGKEMKDTIGNYASVATAVVREKAGGSFWKIAREIKISLQKSFDKGEHYLALRYPFFLTNLFGCGKSAKRLFAANFNNSFPNLIGLSNVGKVDIPTRYDSFSLDSLGLATTPSAFNDISAIATTTSSVMSWNFMGTSPIYSRGHIEKIADRSLNQLLNVLTHCPSL